MNRLIVVGGGARSGKSAFALAVARAIGPRRAFVATAQPSDEEMRVRIARHIDERGEAFSTVEAPFDLPQVVSSLRDIDVAVIDCLTLWLSNLLLRGDGEGQIAGEVDSLLRAIAEGAFQSVLVTNEVGMGVVPDSVLGRTFRDIAGRAHQRISERAHELYWAVLGCIVRLRPGPIEVEARL